jgi:hypothetical protein
MPYKQFRLGKKPAVFDSRTLRFGAYLKPGLAAAPAAINWGSKVKNWPMYANDKYADCTCAAAGHMIEVWTAASGKQKTPAEAQILKFYEHFTTPGPENGCTVIEVLKYWRSTGLGGDKIMAFAQLEPRNVNEVKDAVAIFGTCYIGVFLPKFALNVPDARTVPWVVPAQGPVGDAAPDPQGGHCIPAVGYDSRNLYVVSWGMVKAMSWQFYVDYVDESYAVLSSDFLAKNKAPNGFDMAQLKQDLDEISRVPAARAAISRKH